MSPPSSQLQIDEWILDYLLWYCTSTLLSTRACDTQKADTTIRLANSFYATFHRLHPHTTLPEPLSFRLRICRFTCALLRRIDITTPTFAPTTNTRTSLWLRRRRETSVLPSHLAANFSAPATPLPAAPRQAPAHIRGTLTLRDALWEFMIMSAHASARVDEVSETWMVTAARFMEQAALEAYRELGATGVGALDEAFAYGLTDAEYTEETSIEEIVVNDMFGGDEGGVGGAFEELRREGLEGLLPPQGTTLTGHLDEIQRESPWSEFEDDVVGYISVIAKSQPEPVLAQLEKGGLEGYGDREVQDMLARAGVTV